MFTLVRTAHFDRRLERCVRRHEDLRGRLGQVFRDLEADPFQPRLRLHPLQGDLAGLHAVSVTYAYRITLTVRLEAREVVLLDMGTHDETYRS